MTLSDINARLSVVESTPKMASMPVARGAGGPPGRMGGGDYNSRMADQNSMSAAVVEALEAEGINPKAMDLENPDVQERIASIVEADQEERREADRDRRSEQFRESMNREIEAFVEENEFDDATRDDLLAQMEVRSDNWRAVRKDVQDGAISWFDARKEFQAVREESDAAMTEIIGEDMVEALNTRLWGDGRW
jgi:hypothetical protein